MKHKRYAIRHVIIFALILISSIAYSQRSIIGTVTSEDGPLPYATLSVNSKTAVQADANGAYRIENLTEGTYDITVSFIGYKSIKETLKISKEEPLVKNFIMEPDLLVFDEVVVTGTKTFKRKTKSAVIVNVIDSKTLDNVQACNLSEGLKFQPGLRIETDCQTCNYTQLRMNGLAGGYSQILINGRPIFSPLTGLYGLEQIPVNMIDKIEVIRGGGSSLYGSSAIGGTVNVLTKIPNDNNASINTLYQNVNNNASDFMINGNATIVSESNNNGISFFINRREREAYDHNNDNFSEIPEILNTSVGMSTFLLPTENQKLELSLSHLNEYRYGGEMVKTAAHLAQQSEERTHNVWMASGDYQVNFNQEKSNIITYAAYQRTDRDHYTGILPDEDDMPALIQHLSNPPYGVSLTTTFNSGVQINHEIDNFLGGSNVLTGGMEYISDETYDEIEAYRYIIDQKTTNFGIFAQSDWEIVPSLNLLSGVRLDHHNLVDGIVASPRVSLLYKYKSNTQVRLGYGTGFRAPQAFDTDLHIAFAGGGISRVRLSDDLSRESSQSINGSINYDKPTDKWVLGFTVEGFYTRLDDAFALKPLGEDEFGEVFEKRNDQGATVQGTTIELRGNYNRKIQLESGFTLQSSKFDKPVQYISEIDGIEEFTRTPNLYGFANLSLTPNRKWSANINYVYTGSMIIPHFAGAPNQSVDEMVDTPDFHDISAKLSYTIQANEGARIEIYGGIKNIINSYQSAFDIGKNRDSNFVFGPAQPRTVFLGMKYVM